MEEILPHLRIGEAGKVIVDGGTAETVITNTVKEKENGTGDETPVALYLILLLGAALLLILGIGLKRRLNKKA